MQLTALRQEVLRLLMRPTVVLPAIVGIGVFVFIAARAPDRPPLPPPTNLATPFPTFTPGPSPTFGIAPSPRPPTPTSTPDPGAPGRDERRKADLRAIARVLDLYYADNRSFPETGINPQSLCFYENVDIGCALRKYAPSGLPLDPEGSVSYRYQSDGRTWVLFAILEEPQPSDRCTNPYASSFANSESVYCIMGPPQR